MNEPVGVFTDALDVSSVSPEGTGKINIFFPKRNETTPESTQPSQIGPFPVVLFASGLRVESIRYQWLAERIVREADVVFVLYDHFALFRGKQAFVAGIWDDEKQALNPVMFTLILNRLAELNKERLLAGRMDLGHVVVGGHSFGGIVVLLESNRELLPAVKGVFTYGSRASSKPALVDPSSSSVESVSGDVPLLSMVGTSDEYLQYYGQMHGAENSLMLIRHIFSEALDPSRQAYYVELDGADHMFIADPTTDETQTPTKLSTMSVSVEAMRDRFCAILVAFIGQYINDDAKDGADFKSFCKTEKDVIAYFEMKP